MFVYGTASCCYGVQHMVGFLIKVHDLIGSSYKHVSAVMEH